MGAANKLLLQVGGVPLVRRVVSTVFAFPFVEVIVVTGHQAPEVEAALEGLAVRFARNPRFEEGQMTSVRAGLAALELPSAGAMVCLSDQPAVTGDDLGRLSRAFFDDEAGPIRVLVPTFQGARGNPIVLARESLTEILARGGNFGCRQFVDRNADWVTALEMPDDHVLEDVDRPEDYAALRERRWT